MPVALAASTTNPIESIKAGLAAVDVNKETVFDLRAYSHFDSTPSIGTEFRDSSSKDGKPVLSIRDILGHDERLKALGRLVSERGVVFFRDAEISPEEQKELVEALGLHGGKPKTSGLHIHPLTLAGSELGDEISVISNQFVFDKNFQKSDDTVLKRPFGNALWHSDVTFEPHPSDYATLQIRTLPEVGGDTLWASAYEAYDRLSPAYKTFLEGLTATHIGQNFIDIARKTNATFREHRGAPENVGQHLSAVHPVIRTNPVTGWKGLFVNRVFTKRINELTPQESDRLLEFLFEHVDGNHDIQVRFRWEENNLAIWDNRSTFHAATYDLDTNVRVGTRSVSVGERPFYDPKSVGRREALYNEKAELEKARKAIGDVL
ncbi:taurine dioxygenase [Cryptococcus neoformans]|nr:taurine dioxygenase [Cryptococcus neoformans var. grubii Bt1]OWZ50853.1 taurine dioxygenase [Cryptococcus neoformans var. grubii 125.91]OWZ75887.1 taurine dioxygenase [Cryptococcus neoformans var. grubii Bt85]OXG12016.1 taurine dioxygenase [Cryptococcus neoformans var. grubii Tu401-1]OXG15370.1 taurine dioxygenase [Cryptococcus neoformans var. grubii Ze90-1]OXG27427.1 taurine dioxygenase [Cryptococcus neoformans var. grubii Bt15]OXG34267.1 taurine dioxygenase [Cryptococcus neoformans var. 